jgi:hypothetical protein
MSTVRSTALEKSLPEGITRMVMVSHPESELPSVGLVGAVYENVARPSDPVLAVLALSRP